MHHKAIDRKGVGAEEYSISKLEEWKRDRERGAISELNKYAGINESVLVDAITRAIHKRDDEIAVTLDRLQKSDQKAAALLCELTAEVKAFRGGDGMVDPDTASMLDRASTRLVGLDSSAELLNAVSTRLAEQIDQLNQFR